MKLNLTSDQVGGIIRAIVSALGGYLVGRGITDAGTVATIAGAAATIGVAVWSAYSNTQKATLASVAANPEVTKVIVTTPTLADSIPSTKVVSQ